MLIKLSYLLLFYFIFHFIPFFFFISLYLPAIKIFSHIKLHLILQGCLYSVFKIKSLSNANFRVDVTPSFISDLKKNVFSDFSDFVRRISEVGSCSFQYLIYQLEEFK